MHGEQQAEVPHSISSPLSPLMTVPDWDLDKDEPRAKSDIYSPSPRNTTRSSDVHERLLTLRNQREDLDAKIETLENAVRILESPT
jgi:hypothetical protein